MKKKQRYRSKTIHQEDKEAAKMDKFERIFWAMFQEFLWNNGKGSFASFERWWRMKCTKYQKEFKHVKPDPAWFFVYNICHWTYN